MIQELLAAEVAGSQARDTLHRTHRRPLGPHGYRLGVATSKHPKEESLQLKTLDYSSPITWAVKWADI